jgi:RND family efflux transporter MFP subunit
LNDASLRKTTTTPTVRPNRRRLAPLLALGLIVMAGAAWLATQRPWETKPVVVAVEIVKPGPASRILAVNGHIAPQLQVNVKSTVAGQIKTVIFSEGETVKAGDTLATIDDSQQQAAVAQTRSALDSARARLEQAKTNFDRAKALGDSISRRDLDSAQVSLQTAQTDVDRLTAARDEALRVLDQFTITAPFDGTVVTRSVDPGQVVDASSELFGFANLEHLRAEASVDQLYSAEIRRGLKVRVRPSGYNRILDGEVTFVASSVDEQTGGRAIRVSLDAGSMDLPIGLTVDINIDVADTADAVTVPRTAILDLRTAPAVLVVENGRAVRHPVEFVDWPSSRLIVTTGLEAGDTVIVDPGTIAAGSPVTANPE